MWWSVETFINHTVYQSVPTAEINTATDPEGFLLSDLSPYASFLRLISPPTVTTCKICYKINWCGKLRYVEILFMLLNKIMLWVQRLSSNSSAPVKEEIRHKVHDNLLH